MYGYLVIYEKSNHDLIYKILNHKPQYSINEKNQFGWKVVDIQILNNGKVISYEEFRNIKRKNKAIADILFNLKKIDILHIIELAVMFILLYYTTR